MAKYANQRTVIIGEKAEGNASHPYAKINEEALRKAMNNLSGLDLKIWLYFEKNISGYKVDLSQVALESWGIGKDGYYRNMKKLIEKGYLVEKGNNQYEFIEDPDVVKIDGEITSYQLKQIVGEIEWASDDVVKLPNGKMMKVVTF